MPRTTFALEQGRLVEAGGLVPAVAGFPGFGAASRRDEQQRNSPTKKESERFSEHRAFVIHVVHTGQKFVELHFAPCRLDHNFYIPSAPDPSATCQRISSESTVMVKVAILDDRLPLQLRERPNGLGDVDVVWAGQDVQDLIRNAKVMRPQVVVANIELMPGSLPDGPQQLLRETQAELLIAVYSFARREDLASLSGPNMRPLRAPIRLEFLRAQMMSVIVREVLTPRSTPPPPPSSHSGTYSRPMSSIVPPMRFTPHQLGKLAEITSSIDCECPNHLSDLVTNLQAFERYSQSCQNRNKADAELHNRLYLATAQARHIMETALEELIKHEKITI